VTRLIYVSYGALDVGKALALWEGEKVKSTQAGANNNDVFTWKLTVIGWNSDLTDAEFMSLQRRNRPGAVSSVGTSGVPEVTASDASLADVTAKEGALPSFSRRDLLGKKSVDLGSAPVLKGDGDTTLLWSLLNATFGYFAENCSVYDLANASLLFSHAVPYVYGESGSPRGGGHRAGAPRLDRGESSQVTRRQSQVTRHKAQGTRHH